jgi:hypothetical protein
LGHETHAINIFRKEECFAYSNFTFAIGAFAAHVPDLIVPQFSNCHVLSAFFIVTGNIAEWRLKIVDIQSSCKLELSCFYIDSSVVHDDFLQRHKEFQDSGKAHHCEKYNP